jgi:hypothetical protein
MDDRLNLSGRIRSHHHPKRAARFDQYLRHAALPKLELKFDDSNGAVTYRWKADEPAFTMPVGVGMKDHWQIIEPTIL